MAPDGLTAAVQQPPAQQTVVGNLTPAQGTAATHDGPILVLAGAGSGKTKTLTAAVGWRIASMGTPASRVLAVTFTNKAAGEMRERVQAMLGGGAAPYWLGTFHGLGARQLRHEPEVAGLRHGFDILDAEDSKRLVKRSMATLGFDIRSGSDSAYSPKALCKAIGRLKREGLVTAQPYRGVFLTEAGRALADRVRARHRLVVELLLAVGVPHEDAEADGEGIEHYVSDATLAAFARFLRARR